MGRRGAEILALFYNKFIAENKPPNKAWTNSVTVPIWKGKGHVSECTNYRPIRLLCHTMKIYEKILDGRLRSITRTTPNQCGFAKGCGTIDAIHAARLLVEKYREKNKKVHMAFAGLREGV